MPISAYSTYTSTHRQSLATLANALGNMETPLIMRLGGWAGEPIDQIKHTVYDWPYRYQHTTLSAQLDLAAGTISLTDATDLETGGLLLIDDEIVECSDKATAAVTRGQRGTADATHVINSVVQFLGIPRTENRDWGDGDTVTPATYDQYPTRIELDVQVSDRESAISSWPLPGGETDRKRFEISRNLTEAMKLFERHVINGGKHAGTPQGSNSIGSTMAGFRQLIQRVTNAANVALSITTHLQPMFRDIRARGGDSPNLMICGLYQAQALENMLLPYKTGNPMSQNEIDTSITTYKTIILGRPIEIMAHPDMYDDELWVINTQQASFHPIGKNDPQTIGYEEMARKGSYSGGRVSGDYMLQVFGRNYSHHRIYGLATA